MEVTGTLAEINALFHPEAILQQQQLRTPRLNMRQ
jgi:hypothetical protein